MTTARRGRRKSKSETNEVTDYRGELWRMADALRGSMDAAEYKHVVLGLIFLKYISDAFEERHAEVLAEWGEEAAEDRDEYIAENIFWVPPEARWQKLQGAGSPANHRARHRRGNGRDRAGQPGPERRAAQGLRPAQPGQGPSWTGGRHGEQHQGWRFRSSRHGCRSAMSTSTSSSNSRSPRAAKGGEFYTPRSVVRLLVEMLEPYKGRVYDPCCGSAGMFIQSAEFIESHASSNGNGGRAKG